MRVKSRKQFRSLFSILFYSTCNATCQDSSDCKIEACPKGYKIGSQTIVCEPCGKGEECTLESCSICFPCKAGFYKPFVGAEPCLPCPSDTYGESVGAHSLNNCLPCFVRSSTESKIGQANASACICRFDTYRTEQWNSTSNGSTLFTTCQKCPKGALCRDMSCGFRNMSSFQCPDGKRLVGDWNRDKISGKYYLRSCPEGYSTRAVPKVAEELQECKPCGSGTEYILYPGTDDCQPCPAGLICFGNSSFISRVPNSAWVSNGSVLRLTSCPAGYKIFTQSTAEFDAAHQFCEPCGKGLQCITAGCRECSPCEAGSYKPFIGAEPCLPCPLDTFGASIGAQSIESCQPCPSQTTTNGQLGRSNISACVCRNQYYPIFANQSPLSNRSWVSCGVCPKGALCSDMSCALRRAPQIGCPTLLRLAGEWALNTTTGKYFLSSCPEGFMRLTVGDVPEEFQHCKQCGNSEYILNPNNDRCQQCPAGLICFGNSSYIPRVLGSVWVSNGSMLRLSSCPAGYVPSRTSSSDLFPQQCLAQCNASSTIVNLICLKGYFAVNGSCRPCTTRPCPIGQFRSFCSSSADSTCVACKNLPQENAVFVSSALTDSECEWSCISGFFRANGTCMPCNSSSCNIGEYRGISCTRSNDSLCVPCTNPKPSANAVFTSPGQPFDSNNCSWRCGEGFFLTGSGKNCIQCSTADCSVGFYRSPCTEATDGKCVPCSNSEEAKAFFTSSGKPYNLNNCSWVCKDGFFRKGSQCVSCTACPIGQYQANPCGQTSDRVCYNCTKAPQNSFFISAGIPYLADSCSWSCNTSFYKSQNTCLQCSNVLQCNSQQHLQPCSETMDAFCAFCAVGQYFTEFVSNIGGVPKSISSCVNCSNKPSANAFYTQEGMLHNNCTWACNAGFFKKNDVCSACNTSNCEVGQYRGVACGGTNDGRCIACTALPLTNTFYISAGFPYDVDNCSWICDKGFFKAGHLCIRCSDTICPAGEYRGIPCTLTTDGACIKCSNGPIADARYTGPGVPGNTNNCSWQCNDGFFRFGNACMHCNMSSCDVGYYRGLACNSIHDSDCIPCTTKPGFHSFYTGTSFPNDQDNCTWACVPGFFEKDGSCVPCNTSQCSKGEFRSPCAERSDSACIPCTNKPYAIEVSDMKCTLHDRAFYTSSGHPYNTNNCSWSCTPGFFQKDGHCSACSSAPCPTGFFRTGCTGVSDSTCVPCTNKPFRYSTYTTPGLKNNEDNCSWICNQGYYRSESGTECFPCRLSSCPIGEYISSLCTFETDRICSPCVSKPLLNAVYITSGAAFDPSSCAWLCDSGTFEKNGSCIPCSKLDCSNGTRQVPCGLFADTFCSECPEGQYQIGVVDASQVLCEDCSNSTCSIGEYRAPCGGESDALCVPCTGKQADSAYLTPGDPFDEDNCSWECNAGFFHNEDTCVACAGGTYSNSGSVVCIFCKAGTYSSTVGAATDDVCIACEAGKVSTVSGATSSEVCKTCGAGTYQTGIGCSSCSSCPTDSYSEDTGATSEAVCLECPPETSTLGTVGNRYASSCVCNAGFYRMDRNATDCQSCPPGLVCFGNETVTPKVANSTWEINGTLYILTFCPAGYWFIFPDSEDFRVDKQQCEPCWKGEECLEPPCEECTLCRPGYYKACVSQEPCSACPVNTFGLIEGAVSPDDCEACPPKTATQGLTAQSSPESCICDANHYVTEVNFTNCQSCPPGLRCFGNATVLPTPLAEGRAEWNQQGEYYVLSYCPAGYHIFAGYGDEFDPTVQKCQLCGIGKECVTPPCKKCTLCRPGYYKSSTFVSKSYAFGLSYDPNLQAYVKPWIGEPCHPCPADTFRELPGGTEIGSCLSCTLRSTTNGRSGQSNASACVCVASTYLAASADFTSFCSTCPAGAICPNGHCGLALPNFVCPAASAPIVGVWNRSDDGRYRLISCPQGYSKLIHDFRGTFSHDIQACIKCLSPGQYILNPEASDCQPCPPGLECQGNNETKEIVAGSKWVQEGFKLKLVSCPYGYEVLNASDDQQECSPCREGSECTDLECTTCSPCIPGTYKDAQSISPCQKCDVGTYNPKRGSKSRNDCAACPRGATTYGLRGQTLKAACICAENTYLDPVSGEICLACPLSAVCLRGHPPVFSDRIDASISLGMDLERLCCTESGMLDNVSSILAELLQIEVVNVNIASPCGSFVCIETSALPARRTSQFVQLSLTAAVQDRNSAAVILNSDAVAKSFESKLNLTASIVLAQLSNSQRISKAAGWIYGPMNADGQFPLYGCAAGYLLINSSILSQDCVECPVQTYSLDPLDGCRGKAWCGSGRSCNKCPVGHQLVNTNSKGYFSHDEQQCKKCLPGKYIINPNEDVCTTCPKGATCPDGNSFEPIVNGSVWEIQPTAVGSRYRIAVCPAGFLINREDSFPEQDECIMCQKDTYLLQPTTPNVDIRCLPCPLGGSCPGGNFVQSVAGFWKADPFESGRRLGSYASDSTDLGNATLRAKIFRCPPGACLGNNICLNNATGPVCGICLPGWAFTSNGCQECPPESVIAPLRTVASVIFSGVFCIFWFQVSWRHVFPDVELSDILLQPFVKLGAICWFANRGKKEFLEWMQWLQALYLFLARQLFGSNILQYLKIFISYFQVLSSFLTFQVIWPSMLVDMMSWLKSTFNFEILQLPGVSCLWAGISFRTKLYIYTLGPFVLCILFVMPVVVEYVAFLFKKRFGSWDKTLDSFWRNTMFLAFLVYPLVSLSALQSFNCQPSGLGLLAADYREVCPSRLSFLQVYSAFFILIYPLGMPIWMILVMRGMKVHEIARRKKDAGLLSAMIAVFIKETTTVESHRLAQLLGGKMSDEGEFSRRCDYVFRRFFSGIERDTVISSDWLQLEVTIVTNASALNDHLEFSVDIGDLSLQAGALNKQGDTIEALFFSNSNVDDITSLRGPMHLTVKASDCKNGPEAAWKSIRGEAVIACSSIWDTIQSNAEMERGILAVLTLKEIAINSDDDIGDADLCLMSQSIPITVKIRTTKGKVPTRLRQLARQASILRKATADGVSAENMKRFLQHFDRDGNGVIDELEFKEMARKVVNVTTLFTGAESGVGLFSTITKRQLCALIRHSWPSRRTNNQLDEGGVALVVEKILAQTMSGQDAEISDAKKQNLSSLEVCSRDELLQQVIDIGRKLHQQGLIKIVPQYWEGTPDGMDDESVAIRRVGFLFLAYRVEFWYWETVEMFRKFLMTSFIVVAIYPGEPAQLAAGMLITLIFLALIASIKPYVTTGLSNLQSCAMVSQFITLFAGILLILDYYLVRDVVAAGGNDDMSFERSIVAVLIFISNFVVLGWPIIQLLFFTNFKAGWVTFRKVFTKYKTSLHRTASTQDTAHLGSAGEHTHMQGPNGGDRSENQDEPAVVSAPLAHFCWPSQHHKQTNGQSSLQKVGPRVTLVTPGLERTSNSQRTPMQTKPRGNERNLDVSVHGIHLSNEVYEDEPAAAAAQPQLCDPSLIFLEDLPGQQAQPRELLWRTQMSPLRTEPDPEASIPARLRRVSDSVRPDNSNGIPQASGGATYSDSERSSARVQVTWPSWLRFARPSSAVAALEWSDISCAADLAQHCSADYDPRRESLALRNPSGQVATVEEPVENDAPSQSLTLPWEAVTTFLKSLKDQERLTSAEWLRARRSSNSKYRPLATPFRSDDFPRRI